jgi:hypothetical protein
MDAVEHCANRQLAADNLGRGRDPPETYRQADIHSALPPATQPRRLCAHCVSDKAWSSLRAAPKLPSW